MKEAKSQGSEEPAEPQPKSYPCIYCGGPLPKRRRKYCSDACSDAMTAERRQNGTQVTGGSKACANVKCGKPVTGKKRTCDERCRKAAQRQREKRREMT